MFKKTIVFTHRYPQSPTEADGLGVLFNTLRRLSCDGTIDGSVNVGQVLQEWLRLTALNITLTHKRTGMSSSNNVMHKLDNCSCYNSHGAEEDCS